MIVIVVVAILMMIHQYRGLFFVSTGTWARSGITTTTHGRMAIMMYSYQQDGEEDDLWYKQSISFPSLARLCAMFRCWLKYYFRLSAF